MHVLEETKWTVYYPVGTPLNKDADMYKDHSECVTFNGKHFISGDHDYDYVEKVLIKLCDLFGKPLHEVPGLEVYLENAYGDDDDAYLLQLELEGGRWEYARYVTDWKLDDDQHNPYDMTAAGMEE